jgi:hypothetical protein
MGIAADRFAQQDEFRQIETPVALLDPRHPGVMDAQTRPHIPHGQSTLPATLPQPGQRRAVILTIDAFLHRRKLPHQAVVAKTATKGFL